MQCARATAAPRPPPFPSLSTRDRSTVLISFEGIDGSGKSTQARLLSRSLEDRGHPVVEVREPGGTQLGERVRDLLLDASSSIDPLAELFLFTAARAQLVANVIIPALDAGCTVIADRFYDSTVAYQGAGRELASVADIADLQRLATSGLEPARTYFIDVPVEIALERRGNATDRMESVGHDFYRRVVNGYRSLSSRSPRFVRLDGTLPVDKLSTLILADALSVLAER